MHIGLTNHSLQRLNQRFPQIFTDGTIKTTRKQLDHLRQISKIVYHEPTNNTDVYIGSFFKMILSSNHSHNLVTFIA
jgi:predicted chitinase